MSDNPFTQQVAAKPEITYEITGDSTPVLSLKIPKGMRVFAEPGRMQSYQGASMRASAAGAGVGGIINRLLGGAALLLNEFRADKEGAEVTFSTSVPGRIIPLQLEKGEFLYAQPGTFLAGSDTINISAHFPGIDKALFAKTGVFMQKIEGPGTVFLALGGKATEKQLAAGEEMIVSNGSIGFFSSNTKYDLMINNPGNILFSGEGLVSAKMTGPGTVYLQSMPIQELAKSINKHLPKEHTRNTPDNSGKDPETGENKRAASFVEKVEQAAHAANHISHNIHR